MGRRWRLHQDPLTAGAGETVELRPAQAHHVSRVLRLAAGEEVALFDGRGQAWVAKLETVAPGRVTARLERPVEDAVEPPVALTLFQAACPPQRMDWIVQKAVEVGVAQIRVLETARSERLRGMPERLARWRRIAVEACKQCGRRWVPPIEACASLPPPPAEVLALVLDPEPPAPPLASWVVGEPAAGTSVWLACGPEGGLTTEETAAWSAAGWGRAALGPRILRADTAGIVGATLVLHRWGDLGRHVDSPGGGS
jgi:16S rRNA (uracil1498-N3)-methyltransferase